VSAGRVQGEPKKPAAILPDRLLSREYSATRLSESSRSGSAKGSEDASASLATCVRIRVDATRGIARCTMHCCVVDARYLDTPPYDMMKSISGATSLDASASFVETNAVSPIWMR
jgi:hypothetical protein